MTLFPLHRGTILRKTSKDSEEVGIVAGLKVGGFLGPEYDGVEVIHGWIYDPPSCGLFTLTFTSAKRGIWQIASEEDAAKVRALFLEHAESWGPTSLAWIVNEPLGPALTPPIAKHL